MGDLFEEWTRDQDGNPVIWNKPPYRQPDGRVSFLVPGERKDVLADPDTHHKRIREYYLLVERDTGMMRSGRRIKKAASDPER